MSDKPTRIFENITKGLDEGNKIDVIYLDFSKAFDKVSHKKLLYKVADLGINGNILNWLGNYLSGRKQRVVLNGEISSLIEVTSGVPQGSVLGPVLFLIFINDLDMGTGCGIKKFTDDTKIYGKANNLKDWENLQNNLNILTNWANMWDMEFNVLKCKCMKLGRNDNNDNHTYLMGQTELGFTGMERDLGIISTSNFKTSEQCSTAAKRANRVLGMIRRVIKTRTAKVLLPLYKTLVRPHLEYAVQA